MLLLTKRVLNHLPFIFILMCLIKQHHCRHRESCLISLPSVGVAFLQLKTFEMLCVRKPLAYNNSSYKTHLHVYYIGGNCSLLQYDDPYTITVSAVPYIPNGEKWKGVTSAWRTHTSRRNLQTTALKAEKRLTTPQERQTETSSQSTFTSEGLLPGL